MKKDNMIIEKEGKKDEEPQRQNKMWREEKMNSTKIRDKEGYKDVERQGELMKYKERKKVDGSKKRERERKMNGKIR